MSTDCKNTNPLSREGTTQVRRLIDALLPENVKLHELKVEDWLAFAKDYASLVKYYKSSDPENADGDWESFFPEKDEISEFLNFSIDGITEPHLALFIAFLKLLYYPQNSLNQIPKRHLDFYYGEVLKLSPREFSPDTVHLIFELAKNAETELVADQSALEAGKDAEGNKRQYLTEGDFVVNQAKIGALHGLFTDQDGELRYALQPNTKDGLEEPLEEDLSWSAFGNPLWPLAELEFALSGKIFDLGQGERVLNFNWEFDKDFDYDGPIYASLTTEEGWTDPLVVDVSGSKHNEWKVVISAEEASISPYVEEIHLKRLKTVLPAIKFHMEDPSAYEQARDVVVSKVTITATVNGVTDLIIKNELGLQPTDKSFMPYGPRPKKNASLNVECPEFDGKEIASFDLAFNWLNLPPNFSNHYSHYDDAILAQQQEELNNLGYLMPYFILEGDSPFLYEFQKTPLDLTNTQADTRRETFKFLVSSPYYEGETEFEMFTGLPQIQKNAAKTHLNGGNIKLRLKESFYHDLYNDIYVSVITQNAFTGVTPDLLPNEPYTPLVDSVSLGYSAIATVNLNEDGLDGDLVEFHHLNPFGSSQVDSKTTLLQDQLGNNLYIGLADAHQRDVVSLLFQVSEGSENPELSTFAPGQEIRWSVLAENDKWQPLGETDILLNSTNNFLRSGIVRLSLPRESTHSHFLLGDEMIWLRAQLLKKPEAVARFIGVHTQATTALFNNNNNSLEHLTSGLAPGEIKQLVNRKSKIKGVEQPYASFNGKPQESDQDFYRRTSERLRHKDRAVTIWDFEHLTLEEFPQIHKVKCLNHTRFNNNKVQERAPGHVTLVVVPKVSDANATYGLYPTVSQNTKDEIQAYLLPKQGLHVDMKVVNPIYELVEFDFKVRFHKEYDYNFFRTQLEEELIALLAPWAYDSSVEIKFNNSIYSYDVINFIENLEYVDFLEDFKMYHKPTGESWQIKSRISPSNAMAVLAPKQAHIIEEAQIC
ncbi:MAG: hypothetical protein AAF361_04305 [Bacteroidota bacterium]